MYNPDFNSPEFEGIKNEAGLTVLFMGSYFYAEIYNYANFVKFYKIIL